MNYVQDVLAAADYAGGRPVHALAACFGAVWTLCAATQEHPFSGVEIEAPTTSLQDYYANDPLARTFLAVLWRLFPKRAANATPIDAIGRLAGIPRLLVIGGVEDTIAPLDMSRRVYEACNLPRATRDLVRRRCQTPARFRDRTRRVRTPGGTFSGRRIRELGAGLVAFSR